MANAIKEIEKWLETKPEVVKRNVEIVTEVQGGVLLHISKDTSIRKFVPLIGHRQGFSEDRTVPRICTSPYLLGAIIGYASTIDDFYMGELDKMYRGGYRIYAFDFDVALKPTSRLVYDAKKTEEHWLVPYNQETFEYSAAGVGKFFYRTIQTVRKNKVLEDEVTIYIEVTSDNGIYFSADLLLTKGYWQIEGMHPKSVSSTSTIRALNVKEITSSEYKSIKNETCALLDNSSPNFFAW